MRGLTVRWSLGNAPADVDAQLAAYLRDISHAKFTGKPGLSFKTWRSRSGEWFEGNYVFADDAERAAFQAEFETGAAESAGSRIIGSSPILIEPCEVPAIAAGEAGFSPAKP